MKRVLITGATGFIGSHILEALEGREDIEIVVACRNLSHLPARFHSRARVGDLDDSAYVEAIVQDIDVLCHAAAWTSLWGHEAQSDALFLRPCLELIRQARQAGVKRFINNSTTSAASPGASADPMSEGIPRSYWPHLSNVIRIENALRDQADASFQVVNLRLGIFTGRRYGIGILPILLPRLKTHLVPWVQGGNTSLPLIDGRDVGQAFARAVTAEGLADYEAFNIVGPEIPTVREVVDYIHEVDAYPRPHFSVPFNMAYGFAWLMERLDPAVPWEPLVTRSIIHLLEEVGVDNRLAEQRLDYQPAVHWRDSVDAQLEEMQSRQTRPMSMAKPVSR